MKKSKHIVGIKRDLLNNNICDKISPKVIPKKTFSVPKTLRVSPARG